MVSTRSNPSNQSPSRSSHGRPGGRKSGSRGRKQPQRQSNANEEDQETNSSTNHSNLPYSGLTLENYESLLPSWTDKQLRQVLGRQKGGSSQIPPEVKEALLFHKMNYNKIKLMLALIGKVSAKTVNSWLGEDGPSRKKSNWNRYVAYSKESANTPVPPKGCPYGWDERNGHLGGAWKLLPEDSQMVFDAKVFRHFSKIPIAYDGEVDEDDEDNENDDEREPLDGNTAKQLISQEEEEKYQPLYENLVNHEKVKLMLSGKQPDKPNSKKEKQVTDHIIRINSELFTLSTACNLTYYLLVSTRYPGPGSFCKELSNDSTWLQVAHEKWSAEATFEAYSQG
ncbi:hypothetical protein PSHT_10846 [Puccinia striiformis]|uniref:Uncharacterized protein n=1 Tax=Puccinia striiformis TaxID=27350 RepID=A0A2S4V6U6_9BASI|nr:hypothetical protein PSHT_10846 [Puccinia striiformis]